jgi:hypothetical protein
MILAYRIQELNLTDRMLAATLRAAGDAGYDADDWVLLAEIERLEGRLMTSLEKLGYRVTVERRAA